MRPIAVASRTAPSSALQITQWTSNQSFGSRSLAHWLSRQYSLPCAGDGGAGRKRRLSNASCSGGRGFKTENEKGAGVGRASSGLRRRAKGVLEPLQLKAAACVRTRHPEHRQSEYHRATQRQLPNLAVHAVGVGNSHWYHGTSSRPPASVCSPAAARRLVAQAGRKLRLGRMTSR